MGDPMSESIDVGQQRPRKEEILDVATSLFAERGYDGTSVNDVAERVGMRKASLFYHFATKDALYDAVLERIAAVMSGTIERTLTGTGTFSERTVTAADAITRMFAENPAAARLLVREAMSWGPVARRGLLESLLRLLQTGAAFIRGGQEAGEFVDGSPEQLVLTCVGMHVLPFAIGSLVEAYIGTSPYSAEFVEARRAAASQHARAMLVKP
jgi:AcrR family transcriptional regulator